MEKELKLITVEKRLTAAEVKTLVATDVEIVAAPGAGKSLIMLWGSVTLDYKTTTYTWANTDHSITLGGTATVNDAMAQALIEATADYTLFFPGKVATAQLAENTAIALQAAGTGEPATGDGELVVRVMYAVVDNDNAG